MYMTIFDNSSIWLIIQLHQYYQTLLYFFIDYTYFFIDLYIFTLFSIKKFLRRRNTVMEKKPVLFLFR